MAIATSSVKGRRQLHFDTLDDMLAEVERLNQGEVQALGNWSPGQVLRHLVIVMNGSLDGIDHRAPWYIRAIGKVIKQRMLKKAMPAGFNLPPKALAVLGPPSTEWADGVRQFRDAVKRLKAEPQRHPHPVLGALTREEWDQLHCRHSEMHLSFLTPVSR
jgi:Protein of unknown function (DUF1569)